jgi:hypothetical protein
MSYNCAETDSPRSLVRDKLIRISVLCFKCMQASYSEYESLKNLLRLNTVITDKDTHHGKPDITVNDTTTNITQLSNWHSCPY